jgi:hypothetical protein
MTFPSDIFERIFDYKEGLFKKELAKLIVNPIYFEEIKKISYRSRFFTYDF